MRASSGNSPEDKTYCNMLSVVVKQNQVAADHIMLLRYLLECRDLHQCLFLIILMLANQSAVSLQLEAVYDYLKIRAKEYHPLYAAEIVSIGWEIMKLTPGMTPAKQL